MTAIHPHVAWTLAGIAGLLVVAGLAVLVVRRIWPDRDFTELRLRVRTWWVIVAAFAAVLCLDLGWALAFLAFVSFLALKEFLSLIPTRRVDRRVLFGAYLAIPLQFWWVFREWYGMFIIWIPVYVFLFLSARLVVAGETKGYLRAIGTLHWGLMTCVYSLSHVAYFLVLPPVVDGGPGGTGLLLYCVLLTQLNDVAQYCWGKSLGWRKVLPEVSPGKTWAGLIGGVLTTAVLGWLLAPWLTPLGADLAPLATKGYGPHALWSLRGMLAGLLIGVAGFFGDVTISAFKRDLGIKDCGFILPGHGGVLDRVDSLTFTAPIFFHFVYWLHY